MGAGAVALWPPATYTFDPAKALGFAVPLAAWVFAELFPEPSDDAELATDEPQSMHPHDQALANILFTKADGNFVRFLSDHDFGGTWQRDNMQPAFALEDFLNDPNSVFEDAYLNDVLASLKLKNAAFVKNICQYGGTLRGHKDLYDMIPYREKETGERSERTEARVNETNALADELAKALTELYAAFRAKGLPLVREEPAPQGEWRPLAEPRDPTLFVDER
ncbi:MAG: hypothetical protein AAFS13_02740 [Pseudomonadota bacterium]